MNTASIKSFTHCTSNENGNPEVSIEYERTFLQWLFRKPNTVKTFVEYVFSSGRWYDKETNEPMDDVTNLYILSNLIYHGVQ